ncbi:sugar kinase [Anaerostipes sp.]|uniref:sugar kinase n=1 Tax=Anaerostipes sp. TaxID=1872530 RepID=UPI0025C42E1F|nr:sugar kinase [Anaerostipes sp.]MBS7006846.1 sugar kinase [Anaerostipes sp.]
MGKITALGEIMLRLSPPGNQRLVQASSFDVTYGGTEANIAVALSNYGHEVRYVTRLPSNAIGDCAAATLKKSGVNCSGIQYGGRRLGIYFLENGVSVRPSSVVYDRAGSSMAEAEPSDFNWDRLLADTEWFHTSGITPVISKNAARITLEALKTAREKGITTSFDLNYRAKLWTENRKEKQEIMRELMSYVDICFGNARDAALVLGYEEEGTDFITGDYQICVDEEHMQNVRKAYGFTYLVSSLRESISASDNRYGAEAAGDFGLCRGKQYMVHIVDRVGSGDAFAAGFIHGIIEGWPPERSLEFATASAAVKHTIPGDMNYVSAAEIESLAASGGSGRVVR